jgi:peptide deformylase
VTVRPVVRYPDPILTRPADPAGRLTEALRTLAADLVDTMRASPATVGLAAPQIGESISCFVLDVTGHRRAATSNGLVMLFDPEIVEASDPDVLREGCLSVPDVTANVRRARRLWVRGVDPEGRERTHHALDRVASGSDLFPRKVYR